MGGPGPRRPASIHFQLGEALSTGLRERLYRERATLPMGLIAVFVVLVSRWCGTRDVVVPVNVMGRHISEIAHTVGYFSHILHLRIQLSENDTFGDVLRRVAHEYATACEHDDFGRIVACMPQFTRGAWFECEPEAHDAHMTERFDGALKVQLFPVPRKAVRVADNDVAFDFGLFFSETAQGVTGVCSYRADRFAASTMERFVLDLQWLAQTFVESSRQQLKELGVV
jgi:non-ribosomal peptide synthetase component F